MKNGGFKEVIPFPISRGSRAISFHPIISLADSKPTLLSGYNCSGFQLIFMKLYGLQANGGLLPGGKINQANNPGMWSLVNNSQFAKILVQSHQNAPFPMSLFKDFIIARVFLPIPRPYYIMTCGPQFLNHAAPHASIQKDPHAPVPTKRGSILSWLTILRA